MYTLRFDNPRTWPVQGMSSTWSTRHVPDGHGPRLETIAYEVDLAQQRGAQGQPFACVLTQNMGEHDADDGV